MLEGGGTYTCLYCPDLLTEVITILFGLCFCFPKCEWWWTFWWALQAAQLCRLLPLSAAWRSCPPCLRLYLGEAKPSHLGENKRIKNPFSVRFGAGCWARGAGAERAAAEGLRRGGAAAGPALPGGGSGAAVRDCRWVGSGAGAEPPGSHSGAGAVGWPPPGADSGSAGAPARGNTFMVDLMNFGIY